MQKTTFPAPNFPVLHLRLATLEPLFASATPSHKNQKKEMPTKQGDVTFNDAPCWRSPESLLPNKPKMDKLFMCGIRENTHTRTQTKLNDKNVRQRDLDHQQRSRATTPRPPRPQLQQHDPQSEQRCCVRDDCRAPVSHHEGQVQPQQRKA